MGRRRGLKMKMQMPEENEDTESENEVVQEKEVASSSSSVDESSSEEELQKKEGGSSSSYGSSSDSSEDSEEERPREKKTDVVKVEVGSDSGSSSGDSSETEASSSDDSKSEEERPRKKKQTQKRKPNKSGSFKRLKRVGASNSSSEDDSDLGEKSPQTAKDSKESVKEEADSDDEEQERGSETDSEDEWQSRVQDDEEENSRGRKRKKDEIVAESDKGSDLELNEDEWQDEDDLVGEKNDEGISGGDVLQARHVMRNITARLTLIEAIAIRRGVKLSGPPIEFATTHSDEYARKFRWPQHIRNLRKTDFSQDPSEVLEDHDVLSELKKSESNEQERPQESSFAQVPRPIVALAAEAFQRSSRKRKRAADSENQEGPSQDPPSATALLNIARIGGQFGDRFIESLLSANGKALQGIDSGFDYDKRCWSSLPMKKKPVANWRFVLEHVRRTMGRSESTDSAVYPPMKQATLDRITSRLKTLYGHTTEHEEYDVFQAARPTSSYDAAETSEEHGS